MKTTSLFLFPFLYWAVLSQTITHITQISIFTDLPLCLSTAVDLVYEDLRSSACPQTNPSSAASCLCLKTVNSKAISLSMSIYAMIMCAGISGNTGDTENLSSGLAVFSEYCTEALGNAVPVTSAGGTPAQTGAGKTTNAAIPGPTSTTSTNQNDSPSSSSSASSSSSLSLGEKLAIGVTIPATLAGIVSAYFAWRQHSRKKKEKRIAANFFSGPPPNAGPPAYQMVVR